MGASHSNNGNNDGGPTLSQHVSALAASAGQLAADTPRHLQALSAGLDQTAAGVTALGQSTANLTAAARGAADANRDVYDLVQAHVARQQGKTGGGDGAGFFGGDPAADPLASLKDYQGSLAASSKGQVVRGLARALAAAGIAVDPEEADLGKITATLQAALPGGAKGSTMKTDLAAHEGACKTIAQVLNEEFTPGREGVVDTSRGAADVCKQVSSLVHSLSLGVHTEFLEVYRGVSRVLERLAVLEQVLAGLHRKIRDQVGADVASDARAAGRLAQLDGAYRRVEDERGRQMALLRSFLAETLTPAQDELARAMREEGENHDMLLRLDLVPGSEEFSSSLAAAISGLGTVAAVSARVDKALESVGMSVQNYLGSGDAAALQAALDALMMEGSADADDVAEFLEAAQALKANFDRRGELALGATTGGAEAPSAAGRVIDRRVKAQRLQKKIIVKEFVDKLSALYQRLLEGIQRLGPQLGKTVPLSDQLRELQAALESLQNNEAAADYVALIGFNSSADTRQKKETFLASLHLVHRALSALMAREEYAGAAPLFAAVLGPIDEMTRTVEFYANTIAKKYGGALDPKTPSAKEGGDAEGIVILPEVARSAYDLKKAVDTFKYFFFVAKVRENLVQTRAEIESYGEQYERVLGDAVAARLAAVEKEAAEKAKKFEETAEMSDRQKKSFAAARALVQKELDCKRGLYQALQAVDLYMKAFTEKIVANPDDVADIKRILDGFSIISKWYSDETGEALARAFDGAADVSFADDGSATHYYEKIKNRADALASRNQDRGAAVGALEEETPLGQQPAAQKGVDEAYGNFQALKNIVNTFARIGDKFGGSELRRQIFMSPTQIYRAFLRYLKCSALSVDRAGEGERAMAVFRFGGVDGKGSCFEQEDRYFAYCVKAMAAKVMTVIGVYDLFERPSPLYELTPVRMIVGGSYEADFMDPEVIPAAAELYFRLPRLAEFYKNLFAIGDEALKISMLPEVEGTFSGIIRLVFLKAQADNGDYSDMEVRKLIREVNAIYEAFRSSADDGSVARKALAAFVTEINRRYGVVKKEDFSKLKSLLSSDKKAGLGVQIGRLTDLSILPGEEEFETEKMSPADRQKYLNTPFSSDLGRKVELEKKIDGTFDLKDDKSWMIVKSFRERLEKALRLDARNAEAPAGASYTSVVKQAEKELLRLGAGERSEAVQVASRLILGTENLSQADSGKNYIFHETVVTGLNVLTALCRTLEGFRDQLGALSQRARRAREGPRPAVPAEVVGDGSINDGVLAPGAPAGQPEDADAVMVALLKTLTGLVVPAQGLISLRFPRTDANQIRLDFSGLRGLIQELMADVRSFMDLLRPHVAAATFKNYEAVESVGSLYWLEKNLVDVFLERDAENGLDALSARANKALVDLLGVQGAEGGAHQYGNAVCGMVFYDANKDGNSGVRAGRGGAGRPLSGLESVVAGPEGDAEARARMSARTLLWRGTPGLVETDKSMMFMLNQLVGLYLNAFYDEASGRIYRPLIDSFANGAFSQAVMSGTAMADTINNDLTFGRRGDPEPSALLVQSLAEILRELVTGINRNTQVSKHLVASLSEIPLYMRESYRANLPAFKKLFDMLQAEGELIKQVLSQTRIQVGRTLPAGVAADNFPANQAAIPDLNIKGARPLKGAPTASEEVRNLVFTLIDGISTGCYALNSAVREVLRELADEPLYLETQENSIVDYKARTGKDPLMPLSSALTFLAPGAGYDRLLPVYRSGSANFKMMYGTRKMLASNAPFGLDDAPGVRKTLADYNAVAASSRDKIDPDRYARLVAGAVKGLRLVTDVHYQVRALVSAEGEGNALFSADPAAGLRGATAAYSVGIPVERVLSVTESSYQQQESRNVSNAVSEGAAVAGAGRGADRERELAFNIIDMNIMPINVHALMRSVPLAPLYNYVYTFEQMACIMFGEDMASLDSPGDRGATHRLFLQKLINPYLAVDLDDPRQVRLFTGNDSLGMGRPKFTSDQLYAKALLRDLYSGPELTDSGANRLNVPARYKLRYVDKDNKLVTTGVQDEVGQQKIIETGRRRYNTRLVRNLEFLTNIQRVMRQKLNQELTQHRNILVSSDSIVNPDITEYGFTPGNRRN